MFEEAKETEVTKEETVKKEEVIEKKEDGQNPEHSNEQAPEPTEDNKEG